ncbi:O-antigen ligase family protein [Methylomarinovum caldicuralii]|uniref:O-antigen ligase family protein n=1 Tax=Methylomarinovum caldicuralii TaxID=438856 RepID=UPI002954A011|nr:O-antigen ligase family protein [Methylomarinovum caldicuralii]
MIPLAIVLPGSKWMGFFYALAVLPVLTWIMVQEGWIHTLSASRLFRLVFLYTVLALASIAWSDIPPAPDGHIVFKLISNAVLVLHFTIATAYCRQRLGRDFPSLVTGFVITAGLAAAIDMGVWYHDHPFPLSRLEGIGQIDSPIRSAAIIAAAQIMAFHRFLQTGQKRYLAFQAPLLLYLVLSQSRSILLACLVCLPVMAILASVNPRSLVLRLAAILGILLVSLCILYLAVPAWASEIFRSVPYRPYIWQASLQQALQHPILGSGLLSDPGRNVAIGGRPFHYGDAHNLLLGHFRALGIAGVLAIVAVIATALGYSYQGWRKMQLDGLAVPLLTFAFLAMQANEWAFFYPSLKVKEVLAVFWFPLGIALGDELILRQSPPSAK